MTKNYPTLKVVTIIIVLIVGLIFFLFAYAAITTPRTQTTATVLTIPRDSAHEIRLRVRFQQHRDHAVITQTWTLSHGLILRYLKHHRQNSGENINNRTVVSERFDPHKRFYPDHNHHYPDSYRSHQPLDARWMIFPLKPPKIPSKPQFARMLSFVSVSFHLFYLIR